MHGAVHKADPGTFVSQPQALNHYSTTPTSELSQSIPYSSPEFAAATGMRYPTTTQQLPSWESMTAASLNPATAAYTNIAFDESPWLASFGGDFPQMGRTDSAMPYQLQSLNEQQQLDLMASLEKSRLPDVSGLVSDANTFYSAGLP